MRQGTIVIVPAAGAALSVADARRQVRIDPDDTDQDEHLAQLCAAAHRMIEGELGYPLLRETRQTHLHGFPHGPIWLGGGVALSVGALRYVDSDGDLQVLASADYLVDAVSRPASITPAPFRAWPSTQRRPGAVVIDWTAGWTDAADIPPDLLQAMRLLVGHWDQNREAVVVGTISNAIQMSVDALLDPWRIRSFG